MQSLDEPTVALLRQRIGVETNSGVKKEIATGLALAALGGSDSKARIEAIAGCSTAGICYRRLSTDAVVTR